MLQISLILKWNFFQCDIEVFQNISNIYIFSNYRITSLLHPFINISTFQHFHISTYFVQSRGAAVFALSSFQIPYDEIELIIHFDQNFNISFFGQCIQHIPICQLIQAKHRSIKEEETLPWAYRRLDEIFALRKKTGQCLSLKWSNIHIGDGEEIHESLYKIKYENCSGKVVFFKQ